MQNKNEEMITDDKHLWLEDVLSEKCLDWVKNLNDVSTKKFKSWTKFEETSQKILSSLETKEKIPFVHFIDRSFVYNVWYDEKHIQGLLRRIALTDFTNKKDSWETILDLDQLSQEENKKWVYHWFHLSPNGKRAMVALSPGGTDANVIREFDLTTKKFVPDGFHLSLSKGSSEWLNDDALLVTRDYGSSTVTHCGYPRQMRKLSRGQKPEEAPVIFEIPAHESFLFAEADHFDNRSVILIYQRMDFYTGKMFIYENNSFTQLDLPEKCDIFGFNENHFLIGLRQEWKGFQSGEVLKMTADRETISSLYKPEKNSSVYSARVSQNGFYLVIDRDVKSELHFFETSSLANSSRSVQIALPQNGTIDYLTTSSHDSHFFVAYESFNQPMTYFWGLKTDITQLKEQPSFFDHKNIEVSQHFVLSPDGTKVPYFLVHKKGITFDGKNPTILYGYGGFEISLKPRFSNVIGIGWLDQGGVYVLANIRGGGEYGPDWHQAALKSQRDRAYNDFFAIAEDLIKKKVTSVEFLGAQGGSNGGLLMGVCYTKRPDLFKAINCGVPLLDMHRYHKLLAGHSWIAEYGNPDDEEDGAYIRSLSPYHRLNKDFKKTPVIYLNTSTKDDRVHPGHARKFAAKCLEYNYPVYYFENIDGGHAGASNLKELANMKTFDFAFFWSQLSSLEQG